MDEIIKEIPNTNKNDRSTYLGDGAYAVHRASMGDVVIFTERYGVIHWVALGYPEFEVLTRFTSTLTIR